MANSQPSMFLAGIDHDQPEHLVGSTLSEFGYRYAGLRANTLDRNALELWDIENEESLA
jgi:hypothetical protein